MRGLGQNNVHHPVVCRPVYDWLGKIGLPHTFWHGGRLEVDAICPQADGQAIASPQPPFHRVCLDQSGQWPVVELDESA